MKLYYTSMANDLTVLLSQKAQRFAKDGYRVFYIAPNSLSFEKERKVLEHLPQKASFAITVTRFPQMARYLMLNSQQKEETIDELGLSLVFYRVLSQLDDGQLKLYHKLQTNPAFIKQLVDLYKELQVTGLELADLQGLPKEKQEDLSLIFEQVYALLGELRFSRQTALSALIEQLQDKTVQAQLANTVVIVDGFTRFTAEEEKLLENLNQHCAEVVVGVYASEKAYESSYQLGNLYQASLDFLRQLQEKFATKPEPLGDDELTNPFAAVTELVESEYDFRPEPPALPKIKDSLEIWDCLSAREELEHVAKQIRSHLEAGGRYKDIALLLGDIDGYRLILSQVFDKYAIPYYLGQAESMSAHPLVQVIESLERLIRYNYRAEDVLNLLKSGLVGDITPLELAKFDQYLTYADLKGVKSFSQPFKKGGKHFDLPALNATRLALWEPLSGFLGTKGKKQSFEQLLSGLQTFLTEVKLLENLYDLASFASQQEADQHQQVWKTFTQILEQMAAIFEGQAMTVADFLALLSSGMLTATYRVLPATLDVVTVKSYNLIEPHTKPIIYAIGLSQNNFPEIIQNVSLISDEERELINQHLQDGQLDISSRDNLKRNHYVFASLLNSATKKLVLSSPAQAGEEETKGSSYLHLLGKLGLPISHKTKAVFTTSPDDLGTYRAVLARLAEAYQAEINQEFKNKSVETFWTVMARVLKDKLGKEGLSLPEISDDLPLESVSQEALSVRYPVDQPLNLSASQITDFYQNQYSFFVKHFLKLQEERSIHPDARLHGDFMHKVFELLVKEQKNLETILREVAARPDFAQFYANSAQDQFSQQLLAEMVRATAGLLELDTGLIVARQELSFGYQADNRFILPNDRLLDVRGKIDRLDKLVSKEAYGVVDYKSSDLTFSLKNFYNKISPQLVTYLAALRRAGHKDLLGSFYLHIKTPQLSLSQAKSTDTMDILADLQGSLTYKGILNSDLAADVTGLPKSASQFSSEELELLMTYAERLYQEASETILSGRFAINPYTMDGKTVAGDQLKSLTRFEADIHMAQARRLENFAGLRANSKDFVPTVLEKIKADLGLVEPSSSNTSERKE